MCIILDACIISSVFNKNSTNHNEYKPVLTWIIDGKGKIVYGGSKYLEEFRKLPRYRRIFTELKRSGKAVVLNKQDVDGLEKELILKISDPEFNDHHIISMIIISKCMLLCSSDHKAFKQIKNNKIYPNKVRPPRIYTGNRNSDLLCDRNIADICKPCQKGDKNLKAFLNLA